MQAPRTSTRRSPGYPITSSYYTILLTVLISIAYSCSSDESVGGVTGIQGTVMDEQGNLYPNVEMTLQPGSVQKVTDNNGSYIFNNLSPGDYQVLIKTPTASEVPAGTSSSVTLTEGHRWSNLRE